MLNDPDGRCPMCIGFMIGMFTSAIGNAISGKMPSNIGQFLLPGVQGAIGGGIASAIGGAFAGMGSFAGKGLLQAGTHALSGGLQSAAFGGNFWQGAASSGISSGFASGSDALGLGGVGQLLGGGLSGGVSAELFGGNFWDGARDGLIVSGLNHLSHGGDGGMSEQEMNDYVMGSEQYSPLLPMQMTFALFDMFGSGVRTAGNGIASGVKWAWGKVFAKGATNLVPQGKFANHLFKGVGKLADIPANRRLIQNISNGKVLVVDQFGKSWYRGLDGTGKAVYSYTQNGVVKGAGYTNLSELQMITKYSVK